MQIPQDAVLLRIFFGEDDQRWGHVPLYEAIVLEDTRDATRRHNGAPRCCRLRAIRAAYGTGKILRLSQDLPIIVEIVDAQEQIDAFLPVLDGMMGSGLVTLENVKVLQYGKGTGRPASAE